MAITFPADGTYLTLPAAPKWGSTTCCWFRQPSTIYADGGVGLLSFGTADGYGACMVTQNIATDQFTLRVLDGSFHDVGCSYIRPDTWYFLALTVSSTGSAQFHIGMAGRAGILSSFDAYQTPTQTGQRVFGALGDGTYNDTGSVCWVKAWSAELSVAELIAEMSGSSLVRTANAFACCPLPNHTTLTDTSGQGHPVTIVGPNASTSADVSPVTTITLPTLTTNLVVACVGDSRTEGGGTTWPGTLATLRSGDTIVNDGVSGMGAQGDYLRIRDTVFPRWTAGGGTNTRVCLIQNGINDIANGISLNRILGNMRSSIDLLLTHGSNVYPVFLSELADGVSAYNAIEQDLSEALENDCTTLGIKFIDFRGDAGLMNPASVYYSGDGRHLSDTGYAAMGVIVDAAMDTWYVTAGSSGSSALYLIASSGSGSVTPLAITGSGSSARSPFASSGSGSETYTSSGTSALRPLASSGTGAETYTGSGSSAVSPLASSGSGSESYLGSGSSALSGVASSGSATLTIAASGSSLFASAASSGVANQSMGVSGSGSSTIASIASLGSGTETFTGAGSSSFAPIASSGSGTQSLGVTGSGSSTLSSVTSLGAATESYYGSGSSGLAPFTSSGSGASINGIIGYGSSALLAVVSSGVGAESYTGSGSSSVSPVGSTGNATTLLAVTGSGSSTIVGIVSSGIATEAYLGGGSSLLSPIASTGTATESYIGSGGSSLSSIASSGDGSIVQLAITGSGDSAIVPMRSTGFGFVGVVAMGGTSRRVILAPRIARNILSPKIVRRFP